MKRVFPVIVFLITLSVLGIIFIQMSWIRDAIKLRQNQRKEDIGYALNQIKEMAWRNYLIKSGNIGYLDEESKMYYLQDFTVQTLSDDEVRLIVDTSLRK